MRSILPFIAVLMLFVVSLSSAGHAAELSGRQEASVVEMATCHSAGDVDEVPADADRGYPHHHSICHGHDIAEPVDVLASPEVRRELPVAYPLTGAVLIDRALDAPLRPPIA